MSEPATDSLSESELLRYSRHLLLSEIGSDGQKALRRSSVLLIGAGGLGSPAALYLAAAGVGTIGLVDFDRVDLSNIHRQVLFGTSDVGEPKLEAAARRLSDLNPEVSVVTHSLRLTSKNAMEVLAPYDVIVDGSDNFPTRYLVSDACVLLKKPDVQGSVFRFEGQVSVFSLPGGPCYRCLYPEPPPPALIPSCAEAGVLGVLPGVIGTIQATETLKLLLKIGRTLEGRLLLYDALRMEFRQVLLQKNEDCRMCSSHPTLNRLIDYEAFCEGAAPAMQQHDHEGNDGIITPAELRDRLSRGDKLLLIDVRELHEWQLGRIEGARHIPLGKLLAEKQSIDSDQEIVLYCRSGARSGRGQEILKQAGFPRVKNMIGGILRWVRDVDPSMHAE